MPRGRKRGVEHRPASANEMLTGTKRRVADAGRYAVYPRLVVWGRQPEPVRKHGERLLMVRSDLLRMPPGWVVPFIERVMSDERLGYEWRGVDDRLGDGHEAFVPGPEGLGGTLPPAGHFCQRCGGGREEGRRFKRWQGQREKNGPRRDEIKLGPWQKRCVDCVWWEKQLRVKK